MLDAHYYTATTQSLKNTLKSVSSVFTKREVTPGTKPHVTPACGKCMLLKLNPTGVMNKRPGANNFSLWMHTYGLSQKFVQNPPARSELDSQALCICMTTVLYLT